MEGFMQLIGDDPPNGSYEAMETYTQARDGYEKTISVWWDQQWQTSDWLAFDNVGKPPSYTTNTCWRNLTPFGFVETGNLFIQ